MWAVHSPDMASGSALRGGICAGPVSYTHLRKGLGNVAQEVNHCFNPQGDGGREGHMAVSYTHLSEMQDGPAGRSGKK